MTRRATLTSVTPATASEAIDLVFRDTQLPEFTQGEQTYIDKVKELEERFAKPASRKGRKTTPKGRRKSNKKMTKKKKKTKTGGPKRRAFEPSAIIKGHGGVPVKKNTTLRSLLRGLWWGRKPLLEFLNKGVRLVNGPFLNKRTTLLSLMRNIPMAKKPLVDVIVNKML